MEWNVYIETFLSWPLIGRVVCVLFVVGVCVLGLLLGKYLLRLLSVIPLLLSGITRGLYIIVERLIAMLHKRYGGGFYDIANKVSQTAEKIDSMLRSWYELWHHVKHVKARWVLLVYLVAVLYIGGVPMLTGTLDVPIASGARAYLRCENSFVNWLESRGLYRDPKKIAREEVFIQIDSGSALQKGRLIKPDAGPILEGGRPYIPIRGAMEGILGGTVDWDGKTSKVVVQLGQTVVEMSTGTAVSVNGEKRELVYPPVKIDSKIYADAEEFLELFGLYSYWYEEEDLLAVCDAPGGKFGPLTLQWVQEQLSGSNGRHQ